MLPTDDGRFAANAKRTVQNPDSIYFLMSAVDWRSMRNIFLVMTILLATVLADASGASTGGQNCGQLAEDLKSMRQAQHHLLDSMSKKDQDFAIVLRQQSYRIENQIPKKTDSKSLSNAADAYEQHGKKQTELVQRFKVAADSLLDKVQACLTEQKSVVSAN